MNWAMPCARSPLRVRGPTTLGWKRLSCQITRAKNSSGRLCARAADSIIRHTDSRRSAPPTRAGGGGAAAGGASVVAGGGVTLLSAGAAGALVPPSCASAGNATSSTSAMMAMRAMRDNGTADEIVAGRIAARPNAAKLAMLKWPVPQTATDRLLPPLPRLQPNSGLPEFGLLMSRPKSETSDFGWREREHTEFAALICSNVTKLTSPNLSRNNAPSPRRPAGGVAGAGGGGTHVHLPPRRCRRARHQGGTAGGRLCALLRQARRAARSN